MHNFIGNNIKALRVHKGLSQEQFAEIADVSQTAVSAWECDASSPRPSSVQRIIDAIPGITFDDIMGEENGFARKVLTAPRPKNTALVEVPLFGSISAGKPIEMLDVEDTFPIPDPVHEKHPRAFMLKVQGESMNRVIPNGSYALVDPAYSEAQDGKVYAVCIDNSSATIKRIHKLNNGVELRPDSTDPTFKPVVFDYDDNDARTLTIFGQVVWFSVPYGFEI